MIESNDLMKTECKCHEVPGDYCLDERPRYFPRQIVTAEDLTLDQEYFRNKLRRHNRLLHGWGVVCGALVCPLWKCEDKLLEPWKVIVQPGYILGPYGDEILIDVPRTVDLRRPKAEEKSADPCGEVIDPWCEQPCPEESVEGTRYLAVKYKQIRTHPVRVQPLGCGCDDQPCEYSRWCDGYEFGLLRECPDSHLRPGSAPQGTPHAHPTEMVPDPQNWQDQVSKYLRQCNPPCPPCPDSPWVVLAEIKIGADGQIRKIDNCYCRRLVVSTAAWWWKCQCKFGPKVQDGRPQPPTAHPGQGTETISLEFEGTVEGPLKGYGGPGITISSIDVDATDRNNLKLNLSLTVDEQAQTGERWIIITDANCSTASFLIEVEAPQKQVPEGKPYPGETPKSRRRRK